MEYISPFILSDINPDEQNISKYILQLAQKKALAEFELQDNAAFIIIEGHQIEKSRLLQLIAELNDNKTRKFHFAIYEDNLLVNFLTNGVLPKNGILKPKPIYSDPEFIQFVSPYFASIYNQEIAIAFRQRNIEALKNFGNLSLLCTDQDKSYCFRKVRSELAILTGEIRTIYAEAKTKPLLSLTKVETVSDDLLLNTISALPNEIIEMKDAYAEELIRLARFVAFTLSKPQMGVDILEKVSNMNVNKGIRENASSSIIRNGRSKSTSGFSIFGVIGILIIVLRVIIYTNSSSPPRFKNYSNLYNNQINSFDSKNFQQSLALLTKDPQQISNYLYEYYDAASKHDTFSTTKKRSINYNGEHPYGMIGDKNYSDTLGLTFPIVPVKLQNSTKADMVLIIQNKSDNKAISIYVGAGKFVNLTCLDVTCGIKMYVSIGKNWDPYKVVLNPDSTNTSLQNSINGAFLRPDMNNMYLLKAPLELSLPTDYVSTSGKPCTLVLYKDGNDFIDAKFK